MTCKEGQFDDVELMVNDQLKTFSINVNAQYVTGMTPFDLAVLCTVIRYSSTKSTMYENYLKCLILQHCET